MSFGDGIFNVFIIGPMGLAEKDLHQRTFLQRLLYPRSFKPREHTVAIRRGIEKILSAPEGITALRSQRYVIDIPDDLQGVNVMRDVFNKIDNADLVIADLYLNRPTVYYELALAHSIGVPAIILKKKSENVAFYFRELNHRSVEEYTDDAIANALREPILSFLQASRDPAFYASPFDSFYQAPIVNISAAAGLAAGYYINMVRDVIFQKNGALSQREGLEKFYVIRLADILTREDDENRLRNILAGATGEEKPMAADYNEKFGRPTSGNRPIWASPAGNAIIDLPTPLYSLFLAPRYQRLQASLGEESFRHPLAIRMRERMINAFFDALRWQVGRDDAVSRHKMEFVTFDQLEDRLSLNRSPATP